MVHITEKNGIIKNETCSHLTFCPLYALCGTEYSKVSSGFLNVQWNNVGLNEWGLNLLLPDNKNSLAASLYPEQIQDFWEVSLSVDGCIKQH